MVCHWELKTLEFQEKGQHVHLQGIQQDQLSLSTLSPEEFMKWSKGNDIWALAVVQQVDTSTSEATLPASIAQVLQELKEVFSTPNELPPHREYGHIIALLPGSVPVNSRPYRYSPMHKNEIEKQVRALLDYGLIETSTSPFASPVLLVQKKDGSWHFCVDYRRLNSITIKNKFPVPLIDEILDELAGAQYFTKLDFESRFHQLKMSLADEFKIAFKTHHGHY
jgi:hypothetical protein